ncbi:MAG: hypothetical protein JXR07_07960 [Reichenbachiella sp.]
MKILVVLLTVTLFVSCAPDKEHSMNDLFGSWKNSTLKVEMIGGREDSLLLVQKGEWEKVLGIKPIITNFNSDSTFSSDYYTLDDQLFHTSIGVWWIRNDSLVMLTEEGETVYKYKMEGNKIEFTSTLDWNVDGNLDSYQGTQIRVD